MVPLHGECETRFKIQNFKASCWHCKLELLGLAKLSSNAELGCKCHIALMTMTMTMEI